MKKVYQLKDAAHSEKADALKYGSIFDNKKYFLIEEGEKWSIAQIDESIEINGKARLKTSHGVPFIEDGEGNQKSIKDIKIADEKISLRCNREKSDK